MMKSFAALINRLYFTYSHLEKMKILKEYIYSTPDPERGYAIAIIVGALSFPAFKRTLIKNLITEKIDPYYFDLSYDYIGDLSETVALLWPTSNENKFELSISISDIINQFNKLSKSEIKVYLQALLDQANAIERWAILKLGTGGLRIGVSARFIKQTLAEYGGKKIEEIEQLWHAIEPPYLDMFAWLENKITKPNINQYVHFHPVMLANPLLKKDIDALDLTLFTIERKYDGIRIQFVFTVEGRALYSRTGDNISDAFPDLMKINLPSPIILDGELIVKINDQLGSFNDLQQRLNRKTPSTKLLTNLPAHIILYDILMLDNQDLRNLSFKQRRAYLEQWFTTHQPDRMSLSEVLNVTSFNDLNHLRDHVLAENNPAVEGLMLKHNDGYYHSGRPAGQWYKWKRDPYLIDAVLMYAQRGHGKRSSYYSDYTFGLWRENELLPVGKAYFGFTDEELKQLDKWIRNHTLHRYGPVREVEKLLVLEIAFEAVSQSKRHKSGFALRFPRINRIRWDKPAKEADSLEIFHTFNSQQVL